MTIWLPARPLTRRRQFLEIADAIAQDVASEALKPGDRLPTHRELARTLEVSVATVSKAYAEARRRGLIASTVGRGTFVVGRGPAPHRVDHGKEHASTTDLSFNAPVPGTSHFDALRIALNEVAMSAPQMMLWEYDRSWVGREHHRNAAVTWLRRLGMPCEPADVAVVAGAQHAAAVVLLTNTNPGDVIVTEELTDPLMKLLIGGLHLDVRGLPTDDEGILPDDFEALCRYEKVKVALLMPDHQSPTLAVMPTERRREVARIAEKHGVTIVENAVYSPLLPDRLPPVSSFLPDQSYYITSLSKCIMPGLRTGFVVVPRGKIDQLVLGIGATMWMPAPLMTEVAARWIDDGTAERLTAWQQSELRWRNGTAKRLLEGLSFRALSTGMHIWLDLPNPWRVSNFVAQTRAAGAPVKSSELFATGRIVAPHSVRISLGGAAPSRDNLVTGLETVRGVLNGWEENSYVP